MKPYWEGNGVTLYLGDCREVIPSLLPVDCVVTDPPYGLGFMGKAWDSTGVAFQAETWRAVLRALKPGGHLLAAGGTRTYHRMAVAVEDAGFELRDCLMWLYGSGFPKSLDVSKAIDKAAGAEREVTGHYPIGRADGFQQFGGQNTRPWQDSAREDGHGGNITAPATPDALAWDGWGTALKPAYEPIILARKPLSESTVAANVLKWGTGAINVAATRIGTGEDRASGGGSNLPMPTTYGGYAARPERPHGGRWPANVLLDEEAAAALDEQSGERPGPWGKEGKSSNHTGWFSGPTNSYGKLYHDSGGASRFFAVFPSLDAEATAKKSLVVQVEATHKETLLVQSDLRFFYTAKASRSERGEGNDHPTVKPLSLMRYLCRLITPPGGIILDPFAGSGTTGLAAIREGFRAVLIEQDEHYAEIAARRLEAVQPVLVTA